MSGHTKGPWIVHPFKAQIDSEEFGRTGDLLPVCRMLWPTTERSEATTNANARLIASAPDLLEALEQQVAECFDITCVMCTRHEALIAKAKGAAQ